MKIEIELADLESIKDDLRRCNSELLTLRAKALELSEKEQQKKHVSTAYFLFNNYMNAVFRQLGFSNYAGKGVDLNFRWEDLVNKNWWEAEDIKVSLSADMREDFKEAFLKIGVIVPEQNKIPSVPSSERTN